MTRWRTRVGPEGAEALLRATIESAVTTGLIAKSELAEVAVDTTVQEKNITFPTDSKLLYRSGVSGDTRTGADRSQSTSSFKIQALQRVRTRGRMYQQGKG